MGQSAIQAAVPATIIIDFAARKEIINKNFKDFKEAREVRYAQIEQLKAEIAQLEVEIAKQQGAHAEIVRLEEEYNAKEKTNGSEGSK